MHPHRKFAEGKLGIYGWFGIDWAHPEQAFSEARLQTVADGKSIVPLLSEAKFDDFRSAPTQEGLTAFVGSGPGFSGIYYRDLKAANTAIQPVVDTQCELPGLFSGAFERFGIFPAIFNRSIVFVGYGDGDYVGVFLYRIDRDELFLLTDNRLPVGAKEIVDFEIAGHFLVRNRFAVSVQFSGNTYGVYLATIPTRSFKRMAAPVP